MKILTELLADTIYGMGKTQAIRMNVCIACKQTPTFFSDAGEREYKITGICEKCFDEMFKER